MISIRYWDDSHNKSTLFYKIVGGVKDGKRMRHTIPHRLPFSVVSKLHFEESWVKYIMILLVIMDEMAPAEAAIIVQTQATPMASASPGCEILA